MAEWLKLTALGELGLAGDLSPLNLPPNALTIATNCRSVGKDIGPAGGYTLHPDGNVPIAVTTLFDHFGINEHFIVACSYNEVYELFNGVWTNITGTSLATSDQSRWSGGYLQGALIIGHQQYVRSYSKIASDLTTQPLEWQTGSTWESLNYEADVFRPFGNHMFAGAPATDIYYPSRVLWSAAVEYGALPNDWVPSAENDSGSIDLADTPGRIVDMRRLRNSLLIYKNGAIHRCDYIGGNFVFQFATLTDSFGVIGRDAIAEYNGIHFVQAAEDIYWTNGETVESLLWGRMKRTWIADRDETKAANNFTVYDAVNEEMLFFYVPKGVNDAWPSRVLAYNVRNRSFWFRDYSTEISHAIGGVNRDLTATDSLVVANDFSAKKLWDLEGAFARDGVAFTSTVGRDGLFANDGHDTVQIQKAVVNLQGENATLELRAQTAPDAVPVAHESKAVDPTTEYKTDVRANANILGWQVSVATENDWRLSQLALLVEKTGQR